MHRNRILIEWYAEDEFAQEELEGIQEMIEDSLGYYDDVKVITYSESNPPEE